MIICYMMDDYPVYEYKIVGPTLCSDCMIIAFKVQVK